MHHTSLVQITLRICSGVSPGGVFVLATLMSAPDSEFSLTPALQEWPLENRGSFSLKFKWFGKGSEQEVKKAKLFWASISVTET